MPANSIEPILRINSGVNRRGCSRRSRLDRQSISLLRRLRACESSVGSLSPAANPDVKSATEYRFFSKRAGKSLGRSAEVAKPGCRTSWIFLTAGMQRRDAQQPRTAATWGRPSSPIDHKVYNTCPGNNRASTVRKRRPPSCIRRGEARGRQDLSASKFAKFKTVFLLTTGAGYSLTRSVAGTQLSDGFDRRLLALHLLVAKFAFRTGRLEQCDRCSVLLVRRPGGCGKQRYFPGHLFHRVTRIFHAQIQEDLIRYQNVAEK